MKRSYGVICLFLCFFISATIYPLNASIAACHESGGGRLTRGIITASIVSLFVDDMISIRNSEGGNVEVFLVQKPGGWYGKACNNNEQKQHFYEKFGISGGAEDSGWRCMEICGSTEQISERFSNKNGILRIKMVDNGNCGAGSYKWEVCSM